MDVLRSVLQAICGICRAAQCREQGRPQGRKDARGRLGGAHDAARGPHVRRGAGGVPLRGVCRPAIQQILLCRAYAGHEAGCMAALPRACLLLLRGMHAHHRPGQPAHRREEASEGGRGRSPARHAASLRRTMGLPCSLPGCATRATSPALRTRSGARPCT